MNTKEKNDDYWDYFKIPAYDTVKDEFDNHISDDVLDRLREVIKCYDG